MFGLKNPFSASRPSKAPDRPAAPEPDVTVVDRLVAGVWKGPGSVIPILQAIQREFNYLPPAAMQRVAELTGVPLHQFVGVSTFYKQFRHEPAGRHKIQVCHGTACHVRGAERLHGALREHLHIASGHDTDPHRVFTVEKVYCVGCCSLAPVVKVDDITYGRVERHHVPKALRDFLHLQGAKAAEHKPRFRPGRNGKR